MLNRWKNVLPIFLGGLGPFLDTIAAETPQIPALLGINLGSMHITAATINGSGTFPLALVEGSQTYIDFMNNTTNPELPLEDYHDEALELMKQTLDDIRIRASLINGGEMRIGAILAPEHFTLEMRYLVSDSWDAVNNGVMVQAVRPVSYSAIVYPESDCPDRLYNLRLPENQGEWVLTFHQDFDYLLISLSMVTTYIYEKTLRTIVMPTSVDVIVDHLRSADDYEDHPNITAIVLSSHDGNADFEIVREALNKFDVQLWNRRKSSSLKLEYMAAAAAACMARQYAIFPPEDYECEYGPVDEEETIPSPLHAEL